MDKNKLQPSLDVKNHIDPQSGEILAARYMTGHPRQYRFDASKGVVNLNGEENLTKAGKEFKFIPLALRIFKDNLFERGRQTWAELFFLNAGNQVCSLMVHGYSVENLERLQAELFYDDLRIDEVMLTMKPTEKTSKASGNAFYIAEFEHTAAPRDLLDTQCACIEEQRLYRADTYKDTCEMIVNLNYFEPLRLAEGEEVTEIETEIGQPSGVEGSPKAIPAASE